MSNIKLFTSTIRDVDTQKYLADALGERVQSFTANCIDLVNNDTNLQQCQPWTIINAAITATTLNLPLNKNLGMAFVIPYYNGKKGVHEAQFQIGAKGLEQLAVRSKEYKRINVTDVREGELVEFNRLTGDLRFNWLEPAERISKPIVGYVAYFRLNNGLEKTLYMSVEEIELHAKRYSQTYRSEKDHVRNNSKWVTDRDAMCRKTVLKKLLNDGTAPKSIEVYRAIQADQSVQRVAGEYSYVDNEKSDAKQRLADIAKAAVQDAEVEIDQQEEAIGDEPAMTADPETGEVIDNNNEPDKLPFEDD